MTDLGERIFCRVIGSNVYGADTAYTNVVGPVLDAEGLGAPVNAGGADAPDVTGITDRGRGAALRSRFLDRSCADHLLLSVVPGRRPGRRHADR